MENTENNNGNKIVIGVVVLVMIIIGGIIYTKSQKTENINTSENTNIMEDGTTTDTSVASSTPKVVTKEFSKTLEELMI